ncbi:5'-nucleotidase [Hydra vulgaris]|uniref:5'-nucleotidase n=1 Tax=Hydra vulgaris TaxID=6087 RepID=UPI001F5ECD4F|nr:5'-nucleotidase [Hydra vulgaris]
MGSVCSSRRTPIVVTEMKPEHNQNENQTQSESNGQLKKHTQKQESQKNVSFKNPSIDEAIESSNTIESSNKNLFQDSEVQENEEKKPEHVKQQESKKKSLTTFTNNNFAEKEDSKLVKEQVETFSLDTVNKNDMKINQSAILLNDSVKNQFRIYSKSSELKSDKLIILHFNDVYNIEPRDVEPVGGAARFVTKVKSFQNEPLILFSGDCLNPSLMSSVTKGKQMIPVMNAIGVNAALYGNHDFDFGVDQLINFKRKTNFPWLISNVKDKITKTLLADGLRTVVAEWHGHKIGIIGLVEEEWLVTLSTVDPEDVEFIDFIDCAKSLVKELKEEENCTFIIALTHMRVPNDIKLLESDVDINLVLGGHDHHYETKEHNGKVFVKSGTDFREFTEIVVDFSHGIQISTKRHEITSDISENEEVKAECLKFMSVLGQKMEHELGVVNVELDGRFSTVRTKESNLGNFICDIMRAATQADIALLNSGSLRSDALHPAGPFKMKDLFGILPMVDSLVVIKVSGEVLLKVLENSVSQYPKYEGRFLQVSGISFVFNPEMPAGERICKDTVKVHDTIPLQLNQDYTVVTKIYIASGKDGYDMLANCQVIVDEENGPVLTTIVENHFDSIRVLKGGKKSISGHRQSIVVKHDENQSFMEEQRSRLCPKVEGRIRLVGEPEKVSPEYVRRKSKLCCQYQNSNMPSLVVETIKESPEEESSKSFFVSEKTLGDDSDIEDIMQGDQMREDIDDKIRLDLWEAVGIDDLQKVEEIVGNRTLDFKFWTMEKTLLHHAAQHNSVKCLAYLIKKSNLTVHVRDQILKNTPLFYAAEHGCKEAALILLDNGSKINARNTLWETPLHLACEHGHGEVIILLLARGADRSLKNKDGEKPKI